MRKFFNWCFHCFVNSAASVGLLIGMTTIAFGFAWMLGYVIAIAIGGVR